MRGGRALQWLVEQGPVRRPFQWYADLAGPERFPIANRYVAGETMGDAATYVNELNQDGITGLVDMLGEHVEERDEAEQVTQRYEQLLTRIVEQDLDAELSVKLTHLGLDVEDTADAYGFCRENVCELVEQSAEHDRRLWIDMESTPYTDDTIDMYEELRDEFDNVGICLQSYLKRTEQDIERLNGENDTIRLVKGAYPDDADYTGSEVNEAYTDLLKDLFESEAYVGVATHDEALIDRAKELAAETGTNRDEFEFQFLKGIRDDRKPDLVEDGYMVSEYVPYGDDWFDYLWRRVQEDPSNLKKAVLG